MSSSYEDVSFPHHPPPPTFQETPAGRKAAHREGKLRMKQEKLQRENACKKVTAALLYSTVLMPRESKLGRKCSNVITASIPT